jgi:hypothetical protein
VVDLVASIFTIRKLGEKEDFLGIEILWDCRAGIISLLHEGRAQALAKSLRSTSARQATSMSPEAFAGL